MKPREIRVWSVLLLLLLGGATAPPPAAKWVGPEFSTPEGGKARTTIYYGPWQCRQPWLDDCQVKCTRQNHKLMGCIWIADIKTDWQTRFLGSPASAGGRLAIVHCCCDYPSVTDLAQRRNKWENGTDSFRRKWSSEFGPWPTDQTGNRWPGHHIWDLKHGGHPTADNNVLPVPQRVHDTINKAYPACYAGGGQWGQAGPYWPYAE